jgi:hypothetical protein
LTEECSKSVHEEFSFVWSTTQDCVASTGESLLQTQLQLINSQGVKEPLPALSLNGAFVEMEDLTGKCILIGLYICICMVIYAQEVDYIFNTHILVYLHISLILIDCSIVIP